MICICKACAHKADLAMPWVECPKCGSRLGATMAADNFEPQKPIANNTGAITILSIIATAFCGVLALVSVVAGIYNKEDECSCKLQLECEKNFENHDELQNEILIDSDNWEAADEENHPPSVNMEDEPKNIEMEDEHPHEPQDENAYMGKNNENAPFLFSNPNEKKYVSQPEAKTLETNESPELETIPKSHDEDVQDFWMQGTQHPTILNVIASKEKDRWIPREYYVWVENNLSNPVLESSSTFQKGVRWHTGKYITNRTRRLGDKEGTFEKLISCLECSGKGKISTCNTCKENGKIECSSCKTPKKCRECHAKKIDECKNKNKGCKNGYQSCDKCNDSKTINCPTCKGAKTNNKDTKICPKCESKNSNRIWVAE